MASHPPIPISELADNIERLKANDNLKFSQEYEVGMLIIFNLTSESALDGCLSPTTTEAKPRFNLTS